LDLWVFDPMLWEQSLRWRGFGTAAAPSVATGLAALDPLLPGRGWPIGALTELVSVAQ